MARTPPRVPPTVAQALYALHKQSGKMFWENPAPDAAAPAAPSGEFGTVTLNTYGTPRIVVVSADDWEATYVDGEFFNEGTSIMCAGARELIEHLGFYVHEIYSPKFQEYFGQEGGLHECPETLAELYKETGVEALASCI